jgi:protein SCO1/2
LSSKRQNGCLIALIVGVIVPLIFFAIFWQLEKKRPTLETLKCLPVYGPKKAVEVKDSKGKTRIDTIYHHVPSFSFLDQNGDTVTESIMTGKVTVVDFFFTTCPGICIDMTRNLKRVQDQFIQDKDVLILSHTVDPETDSVAQLRKYAVEKDVNTKMWRLLTGEKKALYDQARFGYFITALQGDGGPADFIHSEKLVLVDKEGLIRGFYDGTSDSAVDNMMKDIRLLLVSYIVPMKPKK